jgi:hypothetical protein
MVSVAFVELDRLLAQAGSEVDAAEAHGSLTGALCAAAGLGVADWIDEVFPDEEAARLDEVARNTLATVFAETAQALGGGEMVFAPLLPDDEAPLDVRVASLALWCSGFLYGLGVGQIAAIEHVPGDVGEVLRDMSEISRAVAGDDVNDEDNEGAYAELVEFVRAGVQLAYDELRDFRERGLPRTDTRH